MQLAVEPDSRLIVGHPDALVGAVEAVQVGGVHAYGEEPVDVPAEGVEIAGVGRGHHQVRRHDRVRQDLADGALERPIGRRGCGGDRRGLGRGGERPDLDAGLVHDPADVGEHPGHAVAREDAEVDHRARLAREHVVLRARLEDGRRGGGSDGPVGARAAAQDAHHQGPGEPEVREHRALGQRKLRADVLEEQPGGAREPRRQRPALEPGHGPAEDADRGAPRRHRRVATLRARAQLHAEGPLLRDPDQRRRRGNAGHQPLAHDTALVQNHLQLDPALAQQRGHRGGPVPPSDLLVVAVGQEDGPPRAEPFREQHLRRLQRPEHRWLVVDGAAAPYLAVDRAAAEGRLPPVRLGPLLHRHDVHVAHQQDGPERRVASRPGEEEGEPIHPLAPERRVDAGEAPLQVVVQGQERRGVEAVRVRVRDGREADRGGETLRRLRRDRDQGRGFDGRLRGAEPRGPRRDHPEEQEEHRAGHEEQLLHGGGMGVERSREAERGTAPPEHRGAQRRAERRAASKPAATVRF
jgi:hypothetical protein